MTDGRGVARAIAALLRPSAPAGLDEALRQLSPDQTILLTNGRWRAEPSSIASPRLIADRRVLTRPAANSAAWDQTLADVAGGLVFVCGLADGALARAGVVRFVVEIDEAKLARAPELVRVLTLDDAARETAAGRSVAWLGNAVGVAEAMVKRGFTPDFGVDLAGDGRVPDGYSARAVEVLGGRNPLELNRVRLESRERLNHAWRTLGERGMRTLAAPRSARFGWYTPIAADARRLEQGAWDPLTINAAVARGDLSAPVMLRFARAAPDAAASALDAASGAAYVDLEGSALFVADGGATSALGIKRWTSVFS